MSQTIAEKIISSHCGQAAYAGQTVVASIDPVNYIRSTGDFPTASIS